MIRSQNENKLCWFMLSVTNLSRRCLLCLIEFCHQERHFQEFIIAVSLSVLAHAHTRTGDWHNYQTLVLTQSESSQTSRIYLVSRTEQVPSYSRFVQLKKVIAWDINPIGISRSSKLGFSASWWMRERVWCVCKCAFYQLVRIWIQQRTILKNRQEPSWEQGML